MIVLVVLDDAGYTSDVIGPFYSEEQVVEWKKKHPEYDWMTEQLLVKDSGYGHTY